MNESTKLPGTNIWIKDISDDIIKIQIPFTKMIDFPKKRIRKYSFFHRLKSPADILKLNQKDLMTLKREIWSYIQNYGSDIHKKRAKWAN